jgi:hypothetical protein
MNTIPYMAEEQKAVLVISITLALTSFMKALPLGVLQLLKVPALDSIILLSFNIHILGEAFRT